MVFSHLLTCASLLLCVCYAAELLNEDFCDLFSAEQYDYISSKRVRKSIETLTIEEFDAYADAIWTMKQTPQSEGEVLYGKDFVTYDRLVCYHISAAINEYGDQGHFSHVFFPWHSGFSLLFERSLLSINPNVTIPYWDYRNDIGNASNSLVFSNNYFGPIQSNDPKGTVTEGKFSYWPIGFADDESNGCSDYISNISNPYGMLRGTVNSNSNYYLTRFGGQLCGFESDVGSSEIWDECLFNTSLTSNMGELQSCVEYGIHTPGHAYIGGTNPYDSDKQKTFYDALSEDKIDAFWCVNWSLNLWRYNLMYYHPSAPRMNCFECRGIKNGNKCNLTNGDSEYDDCMCNPRGNTDNNDGQVCEFAIDLDAGLDSYELLDKEWMYKIGDMADVTSSPNDPIFWVHHMNMDRYWMFWKLIHYDERDDYYGYYESGASTGGNLDDIMNEIDPFIDIYYDESNTKLNNKGPYTARDIIDYTDFLTSDYTYDTILDIIKPCDYDMYPDLNKLNECSNSNENHDHCSEEESGSCEVYNERKGCSQCKNGNFKKSFNYPCVNCQSVFGDECSFCNDFIGCQQCTDQNKYSREFDSESQLYYCKPQPCLDEKNNCKVCNNGYCSQCTQGYEMHQTEKFCV